MLFYFSGYTLLHAQGGLSESSLPLPTQRSIRCMATGPEGFLWIGTQRGLFRYDGHRYLAYTSASDNPNHISQNDILDILPTPDGKLLLYNSLYTVDILDPGSNRVETIDLGMKTSPRGGIRAASKQSDGRIFFITEHNEGYALFEYTDGEIIKLFDRREERRTNPLMTAFASPRFHLASQEDGSIILYDQENGLLHFSVEGKLLGRKSNEFDISLGQPLTFFHQEDKRTIILAFSNRTGVYRIDLPSGKVEPDVRFSDEHTYIFCRPDEHGNLLLGISEGRQIKTFLIRDSEGRLTEFNDFDLQTPIDYFTYGRDYSEYFYAVSSTGLSKIKTGLRHVTSYLAAENISMRGMIEDGFGNLILTTELHGWFKLDIESGLILPIDMDGIQNDDLAPPQFARNLLKDTNGDIWVSAYGNPPVTFTPDGYLLRYRPDDGSIKVYKNKYRIEALLLTTSGMIYLASNGLLQSFDPGTGKFTDIPGDYGFLSKEGVIPNCIIQSRDGSIWIGTEKGLVLFDPTDQSFEFYGDGGGKELPLSNYNIMAIHEDTDGLLWLGTQGGLNVFNTNTGQIEVFTKRNGLPDNNVCGLLPDDYGNLWISTFKGLSYLERASEQFRNFYTSDGFNHNEFNRHSFYRASDGTYYFGGMDGFNSFRAEDLLTVRSNLNILFSEIAYFDATGDSLITQTHGLRNFNSVTLPAANRYLQVRFGLDNYSHPEQNSYAVFLEGYDSDWISQGNVSEVRYNNLPPGSYRLHVRGTGPSGTISENTLLLDIKVNQFFYNSPWFYVLIFLFVFGLVAIWIDRLRTEKNRLAIEVEKRTAQIRSDKETIEKQTRELLTLDRMKSRFFANISHELRTPLTLILSPLKRILINKNLEVAKVYQHLELMEKNGVLLQHRIEELLELSRLDAGKAILRNNPIDLAVFMRQVIDRFTPIAQEKNTDLVFDWQLDLSDAVLLDASKLENIVGNLLSNAVKFTSKGRIEVQVANHTQPSSEDDRKWISLSVRDTGSGIAPEELPHIFERYFQAENSTYMAEGTGIGLSMAKDFAELMGGKISAESQVGQGSIFTLILPVKPIGKLSLGHEWVNGETVSNFPQETMGLTVPTPVIPGTSNKEFTILLAEDNEDMRNFLDEILSAYYKVIAVENGKQAFDHLMQQEIPIHNLLVLSDVMMPEMDGFELLDRVRSKEHLRSIPFIMLTAKAGGENRLRALRMGVDDYLLKPFNDEELLVRIANLLSNLRIRQQVKKLGVNEVNEDEVGDEWLETLESTALKSLSDPKMGMDLLAEKLNLSRSSLHRRIKSETGLTPNMYLREIRLQEARRLFENKLVMTVGEAGQQVGMQKRAYFSKLYQERFGRLPSSYFEDSSSAV